MMTNEHKGELYILAEVMLFALFPIVASRVTRQVPPLLFGGICTLLAGASMFLWLIFKNKLKELKNRKALFYMLGAALFIAFIPQIFIFIGASKTSSINISILWQTEILYTLIICSLFYHERITLQKIIGALIIIAGATTVLYQKGFAINGGDILIILGTAFFPIGNICTKEALKRVSPETVLFVRSSIGGMLLFGTSMLFENRPAPISSYIIEYWPSILIVGIVIMGIQKLLWYRGLRYLDIGKAITISMAGPAFTLLYAFLLFHDIPTIRQWLGFSLVMLGIFVITRQISPKIVA